MVFSAFVPLKALAYENNHFYSSNDILFYDENDNGCVSDSSIGSLSLEKSETLQQIFQLLINGGMNSGQATAVMGNMFAESSFNSDMHEIGNNIGYGLAQWSFGRRTKLENFAFQKGVPASDIPTQIEFLLGEYNESYKSRLDKAGFDGTDIAESTTAWMNIFEAPLAEPPNDPARLNSVRIPAAVKINEFYGNLTPGSVVATNGCNKNGNGVVAGNIIQTALNFALSKPATDGMTEKSDARDTYQAAKEQYNPLGQWSDCGVFIATVMIASGADTKYPLVNVDEQHNYVKSHPEKYLIIENPTESDLQPGDILISTGHTTLYTGGTGYTDVDASLDDRVPSVRDSGSHVTMIRDGAIIARIIE